MWQPCLLLARRVLPARTQDRIPIPSGWQASCTIPCCMHMKHSALASPSVRWVITHLTSFTTTTLDASALMHPVDRDIARIHWGALGQLLSAVDELTVNKRRQVIHPLKAQGSQFCRIRSS